MSRIDDDAVVVDAERDDPRLAARAVHAAELAAGPEDDVPAVGRPAHIGIDAGHRPGFLHILVERVIKLLFGARGEILHIELRLRAFAPDEGEPFAVGRGRGAHRAANPRCDRRDLTIVQVVTFDVEQIAVAVLRIFEDRPRRDVARVVNAPAVGREDRLAQFLLMNLVGFLDQRHPAAARDMVHPHLAGPERAAGGEMLLRDDELAVGAPTRLIEQAELLLAELALVAAVAVHQPDIVAAAAIGNEGDAFAIGRKARLMLIGEAFRDPRRRAALDRHRVNVAEQVESDRAPVGRDVDVHPASFVDRDRHLVRRHARRGVDVPFFRLGIGGRGFGPSLRPDRSRTA